VFICLRPRTPYPPPFLYTVYVYAVYFFTQVGGRGGGRVEPERRGEGQATEESTDHKAGLKILT
jgi:hypothetical protein